MKDLTGLQFGRLSVIKPTDTPPNIKDKHKYWLCKCECGNFTTVSSANLGRSVSSCGCRRFESVPKTHGFATHKKYNRLYHTWNAIKYRCENPKSKDYPHYGGRGIKMCPEWRNDFQAFYDWAMSHGYKDDLTIDRIDVNGNYEPSNCRWITVAEQNRNKTTIRKDD